MTGAVCLLALLLLIVFVPNRVRAWNRHRQMQSLVNIRSIATAWEARETEVHTYALGAKHRDVVAGKTFDWKALTPVPADSLQRELQPTYIREFPRNDAWGRPFEFVAGDRSYAIRTLGRDGRSDARNGTYTVNFMTTSFDADIVYANGSFVRLMEGI
jgi:hypothetical protein